MSTALGLAMQISANTAQLATAVQDVNKRLDEMGGAGKKAANDLAVLKNIEIARVFVDGIKLVADGLVTAGRAAQRLFEDSRASIDALGKLSKQTQISVESLQTFGAIAEEAGVGSEAFAKSLRRLTVELGKADVDKDNAFSKIGLDVQALKELKPEDTFLAVADALANISNDAERAAAANEVFGKGGITLLPLINGGADALKRAADEAGRIGGVLTQEQVQRVESMNDRFTQVGKAVQGIINQVTAGLAPALDSVAQQFLDVFQQIGGAEIGATVTKQLLGFVKIFVESFRNIGNFLTDIVQRFAELIGVQQRTQAEEELGRLRAQIAAGTAPQVPAAGGFGTKLDPAFADRVADLERVVAREAADSARSTVDRVADSILSGIAKAEEAINNSRVARGVPGAQPAPARTEVNVDVSPITDTDVGAGVDALEAATEEQTNELRGLRRDLLGISSRPVDILGAA
jgi:hypothetical protein